jgi:nitrile hydratase subunit beta
MNGAQDLGGMMGFGPVVAEQNEPLFHAPWERKALTLTLAAGACGEWNIDISRHARETLPPPQYLTKSYYDIWVSGLEKLLAHAGMVSAEERAAGKALTPPRALRRSALAPEAVEALLTRAVPYTRPAPQPARFAEGARVRMRVMHPRTHTRLPRYARGKAGVIEAVRGCFVFPDSHAHGKGEDPQWCYTVRFEGRELWGAEADAALSVSIDAWEPYIESV